MGDIVDLLETELEEAFEVKNKKSLHRYVVLMVDRFARREIEDEQQSRIVQAIEELGRDGIAGFERMDLRFEKTDQRFEALQLQMHQRFDAVERRFEAMQLHMDRRFEAVDKRFDDVNKRFNTAVALMSVFFTLLAGMMTALRIFG